MRAKRARNCSRVTRPAGRIGAQEFQAAGLGAAEAQEFQAAGLGAAEALDFQDDAVVGVLFYAQDTASEVALVGPEMHQRIFAFDAKFEMQGGPFGQPFAGLANFHAAGRRQVAKRAIQRRPIVRRRIQLHTAMGFFAASRSVARLL
jgi:hypothetical protein